MGFLTDDEVAKLSPAESLFPSPIPVQFVSSDEFMPSPQTPKQREFEARVKELGAKLAKRHGMSRRRFFKTSAGMAAAFVAMNETYAQGLAPLYEVAKGEAANLDVAQARFAGRKVEFERGRQPRYLRGGRPKRASGARGEEVGKTD